MCSRKRVADFSLRLTFRRSFMVLDRTILRPARPVLRACRLTLRFLRTHSSSWRTRTSASWLSQPLCPTELVLIYSVRIIPNVISTLALPRNTLSSSQQVWRRQRRNNVWDDADGIDQDQFRWA